MPDRPLVYRSELILHTGGMWAVLAAMAWRGLFGFIYEHNTWYLHSQLMGLALLLAALLYTGCTLPRTLGYSASLLLGSAAWAAALSLLPRYGWPRSPLPAWELYGAGALLLLAWLYRLARQRRWFTIIQGHGYEWLDTWAADKPLYARLLARRMLRYLQ